MNCWQVDNVSFLTILLKEHVNSDTRPLLDCKGMALYERNTNLKSNKCKICKIEDGHQF